MLCILGKAYKEGWSGRQVWYAIWVITQKDGEENRNHPTLKIHLFLLWKGIRSLIRPVFTACTRDVISGDHEKKMCGYMALQVL